MQHIAVVSQALHVWMPLTQVVSGCACWVFWLWTLRQSTICCTRYANSLVKTIFMSTELEAKRKDQLCSFLRDSSPLGWYLRSCTASPLLHCAFFTDYNKTWARKKNLGKDNWLVKCQGRFPAGISRHSSTWSVKATSICIICRSICCLQRVKKVLSEMKRR